MNRKSVIIITVSIVLLIVLLITIAVLRAKNQTDLSTDQFWMPTTAPINRGYNGIYRGNQITVPTRTNKKQSEVSNFTVFLPYNSDTLSIKYSPISNLIYVEKKNDKADEEFKKFLETNNLKDTYDKNPKLFKITSSNIDALINEDEESLTELNLTIAEPSLTPPPTPNSNDPSSRVLPAINVIKSLMGFNITLLSPSTNIQTTSSSQAVQAAGLLPEARLGSYKNNMKYDPQEPMYHICVLQPGTRDLATYLKSQFGSYVNFGITSDCANNLGPSRDGMHSDGRAIDYIFHANNPDQLKKGNEVFAWLLTNAKNIGIQYIKFWRVQWSPSVGIHCVDNSLTPDDMYTHSNHIHFGLTLAGAHKETPFFTLGTSVPATMKINQDVCPQLDPRTK